MAGAFPVKTIEEKTAINTVVLSKGKMPTIKTPSEVMMCWYLVHTKPRQQAYALEKLQRQEYRCDLPISPPQKFRQGVLMVTGDRANGGLS